MNRERLTILRDHLASLPDERFNMNYEGVSRSCGTVACIGGWAGMLSPKQRHSMVVGAEWLSLVPDQVDALFWPRHSASLSEIPKADAIAAIQSMLDSPDDDALPVWPPRETGQ